MDGMKGWPMSPTSACAGSIPIPLRLGESRSLANYAKVLNRSVYFWIVARSLLAALIVTAAALALGFPYA